MNDTKHTQEPWRYDIENRTIYGGDDGFAHVATMHRAGRAQHERTDDASRAVACVNALAGVEDPEAFVTKLRSFLEHASGLQTIVDGWCGLDEHSEELLDIGHEAGDLIDILQGR